MRPLCFLDMDGVIADFRAAAEHAHQRGLDFSDPKWHGCWDFEKLWGMTAAKFWEPINMVPAFWSGMPKTREADSIVKLAESRFGRENVAILTSPAAGIYCMNGKRQWIARHYPQFKRRMIFGNAKGLVAGPDKYLIDDRDKNCEEFAAGGGTGILVPRMWNTLHGLSTDPMAYVTRELGEVTNGQ